MTHTEAIEKARKLLRLSQSSNPHEAALAAARAQEIMDRFKIGAISAEYENSAPAGIAEEIKNFGDDPVENKGRDSWKWRLLSPLAELNQCKGYGKAGTLCLIGRPSDVATVRYLYAWLAGEIDRLAGKHCVGNGRTYWNNFRIGAVDTVIERLKAQQAETFAAVKTEAIVAASPGDACRALSVVENSLAVIEQRREEVERWAKVNMKLRAGSASSARYNPSAREAGRAAGRSISLRPAAGRLGSGQRALC